MSEKNVYDMTREEAKEALKAAVAEFETALARAEQIADAHDLHFYIEPAYGMGGCYEGSEGQWNPSSQSC